MTLEEIESTWSSLEIPRSPNEVSGKRAIGMPLGQAVYLAIDGRGRRHLLIMVSDDTEPLNQRETRGLEVSTSRFQVGTNPEALYVDLVCVDHDQNPTFDSVSQDMLRTLARPMDSMRDSILIALARWRAFWSTKIEGMSREDSIGLFGELWFMRRWLAPINPTSVKRWQATENARHDFQWPEISVEVKATTAHSQEYPKHSISGLDQLDSPECGRLFLFSLQIAEDALAANSLHVLVEGIVTDLHRDFDAVSNFNEKLAIRGYSPSDRLFPAKTYRVIAERLYQVGEGFPKITRSTFQPEGLPTGITDVGYSIDLAACQAWLVANVPTDGGASVLHS